MSIANPVGGVVSAGSATISSPTENTVQINQSSQRAIINWQSFNIGQEQATHFIQPADGIALNRISPTQGASQIYGVLTATGKIILVNPAGIYFGPGSYVNVGGMIATTSSISDQHFLSGQYIFDPSLSNASIVNAGTIIAANHGLIALVASNVTNDGKIQANLGKVVLSSGDAFTVNFSQDGMINFALNDTTTPPRSTSITNTGSLIANGGQVLVTADQAAHVLDNVINLQGVMEAKSVYKHHGDIIISGNPDAGVVNVAANMNATGKAKGQVGGKVNITGYTIALDSPTVIDVSGDAGGGVINIGGNAHGNGPLPHADTLSVAPNTSLLANALTTGNGGQIVLWSDNNTNAYGLLQAKGGSESGNGGSVEVSGGHLNYDATVDTSAPNGLLGSLLLDPKFLIVATSGGVAYSSGVNNTFANNIGSTTTITPASIVAAAANILLQANTDVIFNDVLTMTAGGKTLTVQAGRSILVNANITTNNGQIAMTANDNTATSSDRSTTSAGNPTGDTETVAGNITMASGTTISSGTQALTLTIGSSASAPFTPGSMTLYGLTSVADTLNSAGAINLNGAMSAGNGLVTISANTSGGSGGFSLNSGASITTTNGTANAVKINVNAAGGGTGGATLGGGNITAANNGVITIATNTGANTTGGSIIQSGNGLLGFGANSGTITLSVPTAGSSSIGTVGSPILINAANTKTATLTLTSGSGGAYVQSTATGTISLSAPTLATNNPLTILAAGTLTLPNSAIATGTGNIDFEGTGALLTIPKNLTTTGNVILKGLGVTLSNNTIVSTGTGSITVDATTGTFTMGGPAQLLSGDATGTAGSISVNANNLALNTSGTPSQIGGTGTATGLANSVTMTTNSGTTMGIAGGAGTYALTAAESNDIRAANVTIGNSASGLMTIGSGSSWTPVSTFATNLLTLDSVGITQAASSPINLQTSLSNLTMNSFTGALTLNSQLLVGNAGGTTGTINLLGDSMTFNAGTQIGGTGASAGFAKYVIVQPSSAGVAINVAGGASGLQLTSTMLSTIRSTNLRIGSSTNTGGLSIAGPWTPGSNFNGGVLTLDSSGSISQAGVLTLGVNLPGLLLRDSNNVNLATSTNVLTNIAGATLSGPVQIKSSSGLTIASLTDDIGTVNGLSSSGNVTLTSTANTVSESGSAAISGATLTTSSVGGTTLNNANTVTNFNATNTTSGNIALTNTAAPLTITGISQSGSGSVTVNNTGSITTSGTTTTGGGAVNFTASGTNKVLTIGSSAGVSSSGGAVNYTADNITLTGNTNAGAGLVSIVPVTTATAIQLGVGAVNSAGILGINNTQLGTITGTGGLTIGSNTITGGMTVVGTANPSNITGGTLTLTDSGAIAFNAGLTSAVNMSAITSNNSISFGSSGLISAPAKTVTLSAVNGSISGNSAATTNVTADTLGVTAKTGIGSISGNNPVTAAVSSFSATNATSGDINFSNTGTLSITGLTESGGNTSIANTGATTVNGAINGGTGTVTLATSGALTLNQTITANASGNDIVLSGNQFVNNVGASVLNIGSGKFLVWSGNPASDTRNGIVYNFKQYNATYGVTAVLGTGNGFLYTTAPVVSANLTGTVSKQYNGTTVATLAPANYAASSGAIDGDTVVLNTPTTGTYDTRNVGTGKTITSLSGLAITSATNGAATVYGYQVSSTPGSANVGTITAEPVTISSNTGQTKVYGTNDPGSAATAYSVTSGTIFSPDSATGSMGRVAGETVGSYNFTQNTVAVSDGNGGNNYVLTFNGSTNPFAITKASLTASILSQSKVYGADDPALSGIAVTLGGKINTSVTDINGNVTAINDTNNVAATLASLTRGAGETVSSSPYNITAATFNALTGSAAGNYNVPTFTGTPTLTITKASLTGSIANQSKVYGADDPTLSGIGVTLSGLINRTVVTWNGNVAVNDSALTSNVTSLTRAAGELVSGSPYNITAAVFSTPSTNYNAPTLTGTPTLAITKASLTGSIANQSKVYGADDPTLSGIGVTLSGLINRTVVTWNGNVAVNDSALTSNVTSLTRAAGELVSGSPYNITAAVFSTPSTNYNAPTLTGAPTLAITKANLTGSIANQSKVYGADDPTLSGIGVTLSGLINRNVSTWNGSVVVDDSALTSSVTSLTRNAGETVSGSPYNITAAVFSAPSTNYNAPTLTGAPTLAITKANLTGSIANQSKVYGADDPTLSGIGVTLSGLINRTVSTWNGNVAVNDSALTSNVTSLTRNVGETVSGSPYNITAAVFSTPSTNYNAPTLTGTPTLAITKANLTGSIANQSKVYGADDPTLSGIGVTLSGLINRNVSTWNGSVVVDDSALTSSVTSLTRNAGETVSGSPYNITAAVFSTPSTNYNAPTLTGTPTLAITKANLTGSIANQSKVYGADDPTLSGIGVTLSGLINRNVSTWNGSVVVDDSALTSSVTSLTRNAGETVSGSPYNITAAVFSAPSTNYNAPTLTGAPTLAITKANLTGSIANQFKVYGADDPTLSGIGVTLSGLINRTVVTWNGNVAVNDSALTSNVTSLTRVAGELVSGSPYNITAAVFSTPSTNYNAPTWTGAPTLAITKANLTGSIANQSKVYGADDPALSGIGVTLSGLINRNVSTWNGNVAVNDSALTSSVTSLTRNAGENVSGSPYNITAASFSTPSSNYNAPTLSGAPTLAITKANLTGSIANQSKVYGADDPTLSGIGVTLSGLINRTVSTWNGNVAVNDSALTSNVTSLTRDVGETVSGSPYNITAAVFSAPSTNYNAPIFTGTPTLTIAKENLTGSIANQSKTYGINDPALSGINVVLNGVINSDISTWNGIVAINDTGNVVTTLSSLTRDAGENIGSYNITAAAFNALTGSAAGNYNQPAFIGSPNLSINTAPITITANPASKLVGTNDPVFTYMQSGLVNATVTDWMGDNTVIDDTLTGALSRVPGQSVGIYPITIGTLTAGTNYATDYIGADLTIYGNSPSPAPNPPVPNTISTVNVPSILQQPQTGMLADNVTPLFYTGIYNNLMNSIDVFMHMQTVSVTSCTTIQKAARGVLVVVNNCK